MRKDAQDRIDVALNGGHPGCQELQNISIAVTFLQPKASVQGRGHGFLEPWVERVSCRKEKGKSSPHVLCSVIWFIVLRFPRCNMFVLLFLKQTGSCCRAQTGLKLRVLLPQSPECQDYWGEPSAVFNLWDVLHPNTSELPEVKSPWTDMGLVEVTAYEKLVSFWYGNESNTGIRPLGESLPPARACLETAGVLWSSSALCCQELNGM